MYIFYDEQYYEYYEQYEKTNYPVASLTQHILWYL